MDQEMEKMEIKSPIKKYTGCRQGLGKVTGYPVQDGDKVYLVFKDPHTGMTFVAVDPASLEPVIETNMDAITATPETLTSFVDRVYRWGHVGGCHGCPVDEMFCEPNQDQDCEEIFRRWLLKQVKGESRKN